MNRHEIRKNILEEVNFLKQLYSGNKYSNREIICSATNQQKTVLLQILYEIFNGGIPIEKNRSAKILKDKRKKQLTKLKGAVDTLKKVKEVLRNPQNLTSLLQDISDLYPYFLHYILVKPDN